MPFRPVISAYGGLAGMLERLRVGLVYIIPEINNDVTMALARVFPGKIFLSLLTGSLQNAFFVGLNSRAEIW